jgi:hypothetical protein
MDIHTIIWIYTAFLVSMLLILFTDLAERGVTNPPTPQFIAPPANPEVARWDVQSFFPHEE